MINPSALPFIVSPLDLKAAYDHCNASSLAAAHANIGMVLVDDSEALTNEDYTLLWDLIRPCCIQALRTRDALRRVHWCHDLLYPVEAPMIKCGWSAGSSAHNCAYKMSASFWLASLDSKVGEVPIPVQCDDRVRRCLKIWLRSAIMLIEDQDLREIAELGARIWREYRHALTRFCPNAEEIPDEPALERPGLDFVQSASFERINPEHIERVRAAMRKLGRDAKAEQIVSECRPMQRQKCLLIRRLILGKALPSESPNKARTEVPNAEHLLTPAVKTVPNRELIDESR